MSTRWNEKLVAHQFEESISTLKRLPPVTVRGYFCALTTILHTQQEIDASEPMPMRFHTTPGMEQTLHWITWVNIDERKLIWHRAARRRWKSICWELGCNHFTAWRKWNVALAKIAARLNA